MNFPLCTPGERAKPVAANSPIARSVLLGREGILGVDPSLSSWALARLSLACCLEVIAGHLSCLSKLHLLDLACLLRGPHPLPWSIVTSLLVVWCCSAPSSARPPRPLVPFRPPSSWHPFGVVGLASALPSPSPSPCPPFPFSLVSSPFLKVHTPSYIP